MDDNQPGHPALRHLPGYFTTYTGVHAPEHRYDCNHCKYSWCCGPSCACGLKEALPTPEPRATEVRNIHQAYAQYVVEQNRRRTS